MFKFTSRKDRPSTPVLEYEETLGDDKKYVNAFIISVEECFRQGAQIYRSNHGGGMPCPEGDCFNSRPFEDI